MDNRRSTTEVPWDWTGLRRVFVSFEPIHGIANFEPLLGFSWDNSRNASCWNGNRGDGEIEFVDRRRSSGIGKQVQGEDVVVESGYLINKPSEACHNKSGYEQQKQGYWAVETQKNLRCELSVLMRETQVSQSVGESSTFCNLICQRHAVGERVR